MGVRLIWEAVLHPLPNARGKSAAYLSQSARPLDRPTLIGPNRRKLTLCDPTQPLLGNLNANSTTIQPLSNPDNHREPQPIHNRPSTATQPNPNHYSTILRVESKSDSNTTIPHSRSSNLCNIQPATHPQIQRRIMGYNLEKGNASSSVLRRLYPHLSRVWS